MKIIDVLENKSVLILGLGREGLSTYFFLRERFPNKALTLADKQELSEFPDETQNILKEAENVNLMFGKDYLERAKGFERIFVSSGINDSILEKIKENNSVIHTNLELFFDLLQEKIIGITGTKGKSTTASLIYHVLKENGINVKLAGNIGKPALSLLAQVKQDTIFVLELSSYQLMRLKKSPHIAVIQSIAPEHLDYHGSFEKYVDAKANIARYQKKEDYIFYNSKSIEATKIAQLSPGKKIPFTDEASDMDESLLSLADVHLKGRFNLQNILPALLIGRMFGIKDKKIKSAIQTFKPLEHRLEFVATVSGVDYYNDSLSTVPESAIAAMSAFPGKPKILILGGYDRGLDFVKLAGAINSDKVKGIILFPTTGEKIWKAIQKQNKDKNPLQPHIFTKDMKVALKQASEWADKGDVVLLSPASPSFSVFKNYEDRGNKFKKEVLNLKK